MPSETLLQAIAVTAELTSTDLSEPAARVMASDLAEYPEPWVLKSLTRCRRELRGRLTIADVISRIDDGRPGPEEAWSMLPRDESSTVVWTEEMAQAWGIALDIMDSPVQARMAFLEKYRELVREAREAKRPAKWTASLGHDPRARESKVLEAVERGRLSATQAQALLPVQVDPSLAARITASATRALVAA